MAKCMFPYSIERKLYTSQTDKFVKVPCGKCPECLKRRTASWSHRLEMESLRWEKQFFLTLTYNTEHIPISPNGFLTLQREDVTKFLKRLRKRAGTCRYYLCGEYGTNTKRPHYHIILFATSSMFPEDILKSWISPDTKLPIGDIHFGEVKPASIRYTVQYFDKGSWHPAHKRDDRQPEYSAMSHGLGSNFLSTKMAAHLLQNPDKGYIYDNEGKKIAIPRYYKSRLYDYNLSVASIAANPSILVHRDEMLEYKEIHHTAIAKLMLELEQPIEDSEELQESRRMAILNYRASKRKTRK